MFSFVVGDSIRQPGAKGDEDISPYATFHLLGMREENKGAAAAGQQNFQTMPPQQMMQQGPQGQQQMMQQQQGPISPRHAAQTMNVSADFPPFRKRWQKNGIFICSTYSSSSRTCQLWLPLDAGAAARCPK